MANKPLLTQEQGKALQSLIRLWEGSNPISDKTRGTLIREKISGGWVSNSFKGANSISNEDFVNAVTFGFEVEVPKTAEDHVIEGLDATWDSIMETNSTQWDIGYNRGWANGVCRTLRLLKDNGLLKDEIILKRTKTKF